MNTEVSKELEIFNSVTDLNWAWFYETNDDEESWVQFECLSCMIMESKWQLWQRELDK